MSDKLRHDFRQKKLDNKLSVSANEKPKHDIGQKKHVKKLK